MATTVSPRPAGIEHDNTPHDDGLFAPGSITWRVMAAPATSLAPGAAAMIQMLLPRVMWMIQQASTFWDHPAKRGEQIAHYTISTTYGDTDTAERAGAMLRRIHSRCEAVDPTNGERYTASEPELLLWVHNALIWTLLRAYDAWGPHLTPVEKDQFVKEQLISARLAGVPDGMAASSVAELDAYMEQMRGKLAFTAPALRFREVLVPTWPKPTPRGLAIWLLTRGEMQLMTDEQRALFGLRWSPGQRFLYRTVANLVVGAMAAKLPYPKALAALRVVAEEHAFGGRTRRVSAPPTADAASAAQPAA